MSIETMSSWGHFKLFFELLFKKEDNHFPPEKLLEILSENGVKDVKVFGRGGVEVSIDEIKNSPQFIELTKLANARVAHDINYLTQRYDAGQVSEEKEKEKEEVAN
ncbi:hypothetical protein [Hafnia alvei]|uniref:Uncharacterized protein n=1 Tax=Hafnia alvei TaxID=569 RepID=A0ABD7Q3P5_HAFAL|nr:hypothetical protein [Hafnia alvei]TBL66657.1 hypothetical protein EYY96_16935 [Hafnia alvei]